MMKQRDLTPEGDSFKIKASKKRPKYKLSDLLAKCDESAPMPQKTK